MDFTTIFLMKSEKIKASSQLVEMVKGFRSLPQDIKKQIQSRTTFYKFSYTNPTKQSEYLLPFSMFVVVDGTVLLSYIHENGKKIITEILTSGAFFGDMYPVQHSLTNDENFYIETLPKSTSTLIEFEEHFFSYLLAKSIPFMQIVVKSMQERISHLKMKVKRTSLDNTNEKIISQLMEVGKLEKNETVDIIHIDGKITHEKIAETLGTTRETVSKEIIKMKKSGVMLTVKSNEIVIDKKKGESLVKELKEK